MAENVIEPLSAADVEQNVRLCHSVGWPDTEPEWHVVYDVAYVLGVRQQGALVGQGALGVFESAGSIAKMVVAPSAQRQGIGGRILDGILAEAERRALSAVGLVATPFGKPLYESRGFRATGDVVISMGVPQLDAGSLVETSVVSDVEQILALERRFMTGSRAGMLRARLRHSCAAVHCPAGYALATSHEKGTRVGPVLAQDEATARSLVSAIFRAVSGPMRLDVPGDKLEFRGWLRELGLVEKGVNTEMVRGQIPPWHVPARFGLATQAWG